MIGTVAFGGQRLRILMIVVMRFMAMPKFHHFSPVLTRQVFPYIDDTLGDELASTAAAGYR
jgi:hypothetical protein